MKTGEDVQDPQLKKPTLLPRSRLETEGGFRRSGPLSAHVPPWARTSWRLTTNCELKRDERPCRHVPCQKDVVEFEFAPEEEGDQSGVP